MTDWTNWNEIKDIIFVIFFFIAVIAFLKGLSNYYLRQTSDLKGRINALLIENKKLKTKIMDLKKYNDLIIKHVSEGKINLNDISSFTGRETEKISG